MTMKWLTSTLLLCTSTMVMADSNTIDRVYHPYVQALEREIEFRMVDSGDEQQYKLSYGQSLSDRLFVEAYLISNDDLTTIEAYELEARWQLTEQGEYSADWGLLLELEKDRHDNNWETAATVLMEREFGRWVNTTNLSLIYEWGDTIEDEVETALAMQMRYRYDRHFEPAIEFYSSQNTRGIGPVIMGDIRFDAGKRLHWETGVIFGLDTDTPDTNWRLLTEFEF